MLQSMYQAVSSRLARVPFAQIWPGFSPGAFALYQGQLACIAGALQPRPQSFLGNTALPWQGGYLAIWELEGEEDPDHLAAMSFSTSTSSPAGKAGFPRIFPSFSHPPRRPAWPPGCRKGRSWPRP